MEEKQLIDEIDEIDEIDKTKKEANTCVALGVGVGALGAATAAISGAICPLCIFIAPGLVGYGAYKKWQIAKNKTKGGSDE